MFRKLVYGILPLLILCGTVPALAGGIEIPNSLCRWSIPARSIMAGGDWSIIHDVPAWSKLGKLARSHSFYSNFIRGFVPTFRFTPGRTFCADYIYAHFSGW